ncbi:hypothetical protein ABZT47_33100 [Sphaerisporangium sp. NPDC005289]|uniref:hypothetical protein n=1 Tax=Sphaerisporangium sp. NPDC005289 TaxID=3155247 RepID=UPI0033A9D6A5
MAGGAAAVFQAVARLRHGRPLHPDGLVLDAALALHGASRPRGAAFLDEPADLRGVARLSRAAGLPPPLPDILGLALRWRTSAAPDGGTGEVTAELLLATTGHTLLGRRLLRPATRWSPGMYGSLLPYAAGGGHVLLGVVARWPGPPAGLAALRRASEGGPLRFDLVVASPLGPWERFGTLTLTGPARSDAAEPTRFDPVRNPIPGLPPTGLLQWARGPIYGASERVPDHDALP